MSDGCFPCKFGFLKLEIFFQLLDSELLSELSLEPNNHLLDMDHLHEVSAGFCFHILADLTDGIQLENRSHESHFQAIS
jgi:hypothetical protein